MASSRIYSKRNLLIILHPLFVTKSREFSSYFTGLSSRESDVTQYLHTPNWGRCLHTCGQEIDGRGHIAMCHYDNTTLEKADDRQ